MIDIRPIGGAVTSVRAVSAQPAALSEIREQCCDDGVPRCEKHQSDADDELADRTARSMARSSAGR
jgi:hypothetical protein